MRLALTIFGALLLVSGLFWALQGAGIIMWPAESFMLADRHWVLYGLLTAALGAAILWWARRRPA